MLDEPEPERLSHYRAAHLHEERQWVAAIIDLCQQFVLVNGRWPTVDYVLAHLKGTPHEE